MGPVHWGGTAGSQGEGEVGRPGWVPNGGTPEGVAGAIERVCLTCYKYVTWRHVNAELRIRCTDALRLTEYNGRDKIALSLRLLPWRSGRHRHAVQ